MEPHQPQPQLLRVPVLEEQLEVRKVEEATGAVRVRVVAREALKTLEVDLTTEEVEVRRVPHDTPAAERQGPRQEGEVLIVPVYEEVVTVQRHWVLKEELHLQRHARRQVERLQVPVLHEEAVVERLQPDGSWQATSDVVKS